MYIVHFSFYIELCTIYRGNRDYVYWIINKQIGTATNNKIIFLLIVIGQTQIQVM